MIPGIAVNLSGTVYTVPPLSLGSLEVLQERLEKFQDGDFSPASVAIVIDSTLAALKRNYPELTRADVAEAIDLGSMAEVMAAVMDVSGVRRKAIEAEKNAGKAAAGQ